MVPVGRLGICLVVRGKGADSGATCNQLSALTSVGAIWISSGRSDGRFRYAAAVGDGFDLATGSGGERALIRDNVFAMDLQPRTRSIVISGPAGSYRMTGLGNRLPPSTDPRTNIPVGAVASRKRIVASIPLSTGHPQIIWGAPSRTGGRCYWSSTFTGCSTARTRIPVDVVTAGFSAGGPGVPVVLSGQLAPQVGALVLNYSGGSSIRLTPREGWILYEVPADHLTKRRMPSALTTFDHEGVALATEPLHFAPIVRQRQPNP